MVQRMSMLENFGRWVGGLGAIFWRSPSASGVPSAPPQEDHPTSSSGPPWSDDDWLDEAVKSSVLSTPLDRLAEDVASVQWHLWELGPPGPDGRPTRREILKHPLLSLWRRPNPLMLGRVFRSLWTNYWEINGRVVIRVMYGPDGRPEKLWILPPSWLKQKCDLSSADPQKRLWKILWQGKPIYLQPHEVLMLARPHLKDPYGWGVGAAVAVREDVMQVSWMNRWSSNFFRQGAHIGKIVGIPGLDPKNKDGILADYNTKLTGIDNAHKTMFVATEKGAGSVSVVNAGPSQKDMDWVQGQKFLGQRIRMRWGMPPEIVGDVENSNRATAEAADFIHQSKNILPRLTLMAEFVNTYLTAFYGDRLVMEPENPVKETTEQRHKEADDGFRSGALNRNEWRERHGLDPLPEPLGSQFLVPVNMYVVNADGSIESATGELRSGGDVAP